MNETIVPSSPDANSTGFIVDKLAHELSDMSPQLRKAAEYVLNNPNDVGVSSIREIADSADVKPNTLVRMARAVGFEGYEDFRRPFREVLRAGGESFPDRARWLQSIARGGRHGKLLSGMAASTIENIEQLFSDITAGQLKAAADLIVEARCTYVLGVGILSALAHNFAYLARMGFETVVAVPRDGSLPIDDIAKAGPADVVLAMTFNPYRIEVVDAVRHAKAQGAAVIALTDSRASPIAVGAAHIFIVPTETPQFFTSAVAAAALLETLMAFVTADADDTVVEKIERFHQRRHDTGVYWRDGG